MINSKVPVIVTDLISLSEIFVSINGVEGELSTCCCMFLFSAHIPVAQTKTSIGFLSEKTTAEIHCHQIILAAVLTDIILPLI